MKHFFVRAKSLSIFLCGLFVLGSCASFPFDFPENSSWVFGNNERAGRSVRIVSVSVEKSSQSDSLEKEIKKLLPLFFLDEGYVTVSSPGTADYSVEATVREREYVDEWRTKRSLSAELRIRAEGSAGETLPLSAGLALIEGRQSLSSSKTLGAILRRAVKNSVRGLSAEKREDNPLREEN